MTSSVRPGKASPAPWNIGSILLLSLAWLILQVGGLFTPGLLDDVDSIYIEISREMLLRRDYVTPYINGIRFFDKPPLMYWMAAGSMHLFGPYDWAARIPLALGVLALILAVYALGLRLFASASPTSHPDRAAFYAALTIATSIGPYLFTRFYIPDVLLALWMTLAIHFFLIAVDRITLPAANSASTRPPATLLPCLGFAAVTALNLLTKGLIGLVFPLGFVLLYLLLTGQLPLLRKLHLIPSLAAFLAIAAPWHILAALRTPAIPLPAGLGLPARGGWAWFYLYNEHVARFLGRRIPHDYGQVPVPLFWLLLAVWLMPWATFLPGALAHALQILRRRLSASQDEYRTALALTLWAVLILGFFTLSSRQEYYSLPALPALALLAGALLAQADASPEGPSARSCLQWTTWFLLPLSVLLSAVAAYFAISAPYPPPGTDISTLLTGNADAYTLSLGHLFDLTGTAMGLFRGPLTTVALAMLFIGPASFLLRRQHRTHAANLTLAAGSIAMLLAAHEGLVRFYPIIGSKQLALAIDHIQQAHPGPGDLIILDGEFSSGSTIPFYTRQPVHLIDGRVNGLWYGSFWPDTPSVFETEASLRQLWSGSHRIFLFTYNPESRTRDLLPFAPVQTIASAGGKSILSNR